MDNNAFLFWSLYGLIKVIYPHEIHNIDLNMNLID